MTTNPLARSRLERIQAAVKAPSPQLAPIPAPAAVDGVNTTDRVLAIQRSLAMARSMSSLSSAGAQAQVLIRTDSVLYYSSSVFYLLH